MTPVVVGISGPSGSGKSVVANVVRDKLPASVILQQDWYFRDGIHCPPDANFCEFQWLHIDEFVADLRGLIAGASVRVPAMDVSTFERVGTQLLRPATVIIVEGMTIFRVHELRHCFDLKYYLDLNLDTLAERKRARDRTERQKPAEVIAVQLRWMAEEYHRDAGLRRRCDVAVLAGERPVHQTGEYIAEDVLRMLSERGSSKGVDDAAN